MTQACEGGLHTELVAPENGRVVIPARVYRAAGIEPGDEVVMYVEDSRVVIESRQQLKDRIRLDFATHSSGVDGVGALIADRRAQAVREAHG